MLRQKCLKMTGIVLLTTILILFALVCVFGILFFLGVRYKETFMQ